MSRRVKGPDGMVHIFPDDATDAEVAAALESSAPREARIGANLHQEAKIGADPHPGGADFSVLGVPIHVPGEDKPRADENLADVGGVGIPPESVLMGPLQAARAMLKPALSMANRATAGAGAMLTHIAPVVKYEVAKHTLERMGLPTSVATVAAMGISGYRRGGKAAAPEAAAPAAEAAPVAAAPVEAAPAPAATFNPTSGLKAARDAFAALGETPRPAEVSNVSALIQRGKSPTEAVAIVIKNRPLTPSGSPAADFAARYGLPSEADRIAAQDLRNAQGKAKTPSAETARARRTP